MGRLIDSEYLKEDMKRYGWEHVDSTVTEYVDGLDTVEAIPKADYENRLKADMVAMLTEIQLEIEEKASAEGDWIFADGERLCAKLIQQKIDKLRGDKNGNDD